MLSLHDLIAQIGQANVARRMEVSPDTVRSWSCGRRLPGTRHLRKALARLAGLQHSDIAWPARGRKT
mgnify:CR=1 FL=1